MQINRISKINNINFRETQTTKNTESQNALLMLRDPNASIKFQQNQEIAQKADLVNGNPFRAIGYRLYRTFNIIRDNEITPENEQKHFSVVA